jgi:hypothetical protein
VKRLEIFKSENGGQRVVVASFEQSVLKELASRSDFLSLPVVPASGKLMKVVSKRQCKSKKYTHTL